LTTSGEALTEPVVPADIYDEQYYRTCCLGYAEWTASGGEKVAGIYPGILKLARFAPGEVLVDIGTGRGELLAVAVEQGASKAIGIEYSPTAVEMARKTLAVHGTDDRADVMLADARSIPVPDATADLVTLVDVVEHLAPAELDRSMREAFRLLRPGGRVFIHTMPNRTMYEVTYRLQRLLHRSWPRDPRNEYEHAMHVNEQTLRGLRSTVRRAGFTGVRVRYGQWIYTDFVPDERGKALYHRLAARKLTRWLGAADLFAEGTRP
jgi:ubiquinone/menaquinone biosynthesis C-methylase UbiE